MSKIFVSIASYRDADIQNTIDNLFATATNKLDINVGVFLQIDPTIDKDCNVINHPNVTVRTIQAHNARGAGYARAECAKLMNDEDYYFQIDSHMRFALGWDKKLIEMLPNRNSVISTYPLPFTPPNNLHSDRLVKIQPKKFDVDGVLLQNSGMYPLTETQSLVQSGFMSAGMYFAPRSVIEQVPIDPYLMFTGEEITTGLRLWTHGFNLYTPNKVIAYHNYEPAPQRPRIWQDTERNEKYSKFSRSRVLYICRQKLDVSDECLTDIEKYDIGYKRSIESFEQFVGIDFKKKEIYSMPKTD